MRHLSRTFGAALSSLYKAELVHLDGPWAGRADVEAVTAGWAHWFNTERLRSMLGYSTPRDVDEVHRAEDHGTDTVVA